MRMAGKVAIVTGGGSGIGRGTALALAKEGASVAIFDVNETSARDVTEEIKGAGGNALFCRCDVASEPDVIASLREVVVSYGHVEVLVNNAGVAPAIGPVHEIATSDWDRVINVHLRGCFLCSKYVISQILRQSDCDGAIVNVSSAAGLVGVPGRNAYVAAKHGIIGLTKEMALAYVHDRIRVNAVAPGRILTPMIGIGAPIDAVLAPSGPTAMESFGHVEDVANTILFLVSDEAPYINGAVIAIDNCGTAGLWQAPT